jgi:hypothetical protein
MMRCRIGAVSERLSARQSAALRGADEGSGFRMAGQESWSEAEADVLALGAADRLAMALEEVGFDVGRAFPLLEGNLDRDGGPVVELGQIAVGTANQMADVLTRAAQLGIATPEG